MTHTGNNGVRHTVVPNSSGIEPPKLRAPADAADCHIHVYDQRFQPTVMNPLNGTIGDYRLLQKRIGTTRVVIVMPRNYVTDNSIVLDAISQLGIANARGIAVIRPTITNSELRTLNDGGIRGIRFTVSSPENDVVTIDMIEPLAKRIAGLGWHIQLNMPPDKIVEQAEMLLRLPTPIVFDHMGKPPLPAGTEHPSHKVVRSLIDRGRTWVKISGAYMVSQIGPPTYADATAIAQDLVGAAPERMVWGSDWPHPGHKEHPDDAVLFDLLAAWVPDETTRNRILVENPKTLYGF